MATVGDLAALSDWAYKPDKMALGSIGNGEWVVFHKTELSSQGFFAYTLVNNETKDGVIVFRGTDNFQNVLQNVLQSVGNSIKRSSTANSPCRVAASLQAEPATDPGDAWRPRILSFRWFLNHRRGRHGIPTAYKRNFGAKKASILECIVRIARNIELRQRIKSTKPMWVGVIGALVGTLLAGGAAAETEPNTSSDSSRYEFNLEKGEGTPVCDAYLRRLNETEFEAAPFCDRPENDKVPGFSFLHRVPLSSAETARLYPRIQPFLAAKRSKPPYPLDSYEADWANSGGQGPVILAWRYEPLLDIKNDGHPRNVVVWTGPPFSELNRPCGSMPEDSRLTEPLRRNQLAFVLSSDERDLDDSQTLALFERPATSGRQTIQFEPLGYTLDIFKYRGRIYFDTFFNEPESMRDRLAVFVHRDGVTHQVCQYLYRGKRPMKGANSRKAHE